VVGISYPSKTDLFLSAVAGLFLISFAACGTADPAESGAGHATLQPPEVWPTNGWRIANLEDYGFEPDLPTAIEASVTTNLPFLDALLIIRHGNLVYETYYNGYDETSLHDIASVTKSWTSALVGLAREQGHLLDVDANLVELLPEYFEEGAHADKRTITLRHLLTMRSGIAFSQVVENEGGYGGEERLNGDITEFALDFPIDHEAGEAWNYSTLDTQLVSAIVEGAVGKPLAEFARDELFTKLGIGETQWLSDATGTSLGGGNLSMTARDAAKLGLLYLHGGMWDGEQVLSSDWVKASLTPHGEAYFPVTGEEVDIDWYGYLWWLWGPEWFYGYSSFQAQGYGGQQVLVFPELDLIIVTLAKLEDVDPETADEQLAAVDGLIVDVIFPALTDVE
jgi:CubicO group peptidase (beta-lactamase class C family)